MTKAKRPKKMTPAQKRKVWGQINPNAIVDIAFADIGAFTIDEDGDIYLDHGYCLDRSLLSMIVAGATLSFEVDEDFGEGDACFGDSSSSFYLDGNEYTFSPGDKCIHSIAISKHGNRRTHVEMKSIEETMTLEEGSQTVSIGCRSLSKNDAEKAATAIFKWLGYEVA